MPACDADRRLSRNKFRRLAGLGCRSAPACRAFRRLGATESETDGAQAKRPAWPTSSQSNSTRGRRRPGVEGPAAEAADDECAHPQDPADVPAEQPGAKEDV